MTLPLELSYQVLAEVLSDALFVNALSPTGATVIYVNQAACDMHGYTRDELMQLRYDQFIHADSIPFLYEAIQGTSAGKSVRGRAIEVHKDGHLIHVEVTADPFCLNDRMYAFVLLRDVSDKVKSEAALRAYADQQAKLNSELEQAFLDLKNSQAQLIQNAKMSALGQLTAGIAHEINNPLSFIHGNIQCLEDYLEDLLELIQSHMDSSSAPQANLRDWDDAVVSLAFIRDDLPNLLQSMRNGTTRIREIVTALRTFSRLDESEVKLIDLEESLDSLLTIVDYRFTRRSLSRRIELVKHYQPLPLVQCYAGQINQVLMNILTNAIDALEEAIAQGWQKTDPPTIELSVHPLLGHRLFNSLDEGANSWIEIIIRDNGDGIAPDIQDRIFEPFFTTKAIGKGTGIGLSTSYQIVTEQHGGYLMCRSNPGDGSEFVIQIPADLVPDRQPCRTQTSNVD